ncbi:MAG: aminotransferase class III-fold pyridoxal phosphate-dependent enzyme, partial [Muribaculaceae bacterium]|nr:aminotransferase class III-fold pyridoxal phosphate-dependent enzyme [Muribaculaceae bacterium]
RELRQLCDRLGILRSLEEIATGCGRTGRLFAWEHAGVEPDIMLIGKAITGGYMTFAAVATTAAVADMISHSDAQVMMHGPTFMANPLACALGVASLRLLLSQPWQKRVAEIEAIMRRCLSPAAAWPFVRDVRVLGAIGVVELNHDVNLAEFQRLCVREGVWIRPFGRNAYIMPPFLAVSDSQVERLCEALLSIIAETNEVALTSDD